MGRYVKVFDKRKYNRWYKMTHDGANPPINHWSKDVKDGTPVINGLVRAKNGITTYRAGEWTSMKEIKSKK